VLELETCDELLATWSRRRLLRLEDGSLTPHEEDGGRTRALVAAAGELNAQAPNADELPAPVCGTSDVLLTDSAR